MIIKKRFNGPPNSGNGGYVSGMIANETKGIVSVTLMKPPPLEEELTIHQEDDIWLVKQNEHLIAKAEIAEVYIQPPVIPSMADAVLCESRYSGFDKHIFPECFVCGPHRNEHDGLRLFTGLSGGQNYVAAPFRTFDELFDDQGNMKTEFVWSALDCPGAYAITEIDGEKMMLLGKMAVDQKEEIKRDDNLIVMGWYIGSEGKKNISGTAIIDSDQNVKAVAHSIWIEIDSAKFTS